VDDAIEKVITPFLAQADTVLGPAYSAVLYGSAARGDFVPGRSDINLMLVVDELSPAVLQSLGRAYAAWRKSRYDPPLLISRAEWARATDVFPLEITDMRAAYRVLRGLDPLATLEVGRGDLRRALEREFRGKLLRLRQGYVAAAGDPKALGSLAGQSAATVMVLLRGLLHLLGRPVPTDPLELAGAAADAAGVEPEHLLHVFRHRGERGWRCALPEFERYMETVARTARYVDQLQLGDQ
jgi:predicted nucleotidyltransferase